MQIRVGYELVYSCPQPTPMILTLNVHHSRVSDLVQADRIVIDPRAGEDVTALAFEDGDRLREVP